MTCWEVLEGFPLSRPSVSSSQLNHASRSSKAAADCKQMGRIIHTSAFVRHFPTDTHNSICYRLCQRSVPICLRNNAGNLQGVQKTLPCPRHRQPWPFL